MWHRYLLSGMAVWLAAGSPALAFLAYVSNEKSNTVSVIDPATNEVVATVVTGQVPFVITAGFGAMWVPSFGGAEVRRYQP